VGNSRGSAPPRPRRLQTRGPRAPPRRTHAWRPNSSLRAAEDGREPEKRCAAPGLWVRVTGRGALVQTRDAAARATAGAWLTVLKRTRADSACPTRRTGLARSRQRALPPLGAQQGQLDVTASDGYGARRVSLSVRGGAGLPRDAPERSRRAQRARHALPYAGSVPCCAPLRRASSTSPPAMGGERNASAGRCGAVLVGRAGPSRAVEALRQGRARAAQAAHVPGAAAPPMALRHEPAGEDERPARRPASVERVAHRDGAAASPKAARTARRRLESERPSARACCWYLCRG